MKRNGFNADIQQLPAFADEKNNVLNAIVETPKNSRNKLRFEPRQGLFKLRTLLPVGTVFPFDFGFIPSTIAQDGDPIDVLILMDEPVSVGTLIEVRVIGIIEAEQTEKAQGGKKTTRNDRLIAVSTVSYNHSDVHSLRDLNKNLLDEIDHFFVSYNEWRGKLFKVLGRDGPKRALELVKEAEKRKRKEVKNPSQKKAA
jgi:inorganic pyrophosphatase